MNLSVPGEAEAVLETSMSVEDARELTDTIKAAAEQVWSLLLEAHEKRAWAALGYSRWEDYIREEFGMHRRTSYRLLDQAVVIRELGAAADVAHGPHVEVTERAARDIKPVLPQVVEQLRARAGNVSGERFAQIVREVVAEVRAEQRQKQEDREAIAALNALAPPGFDAKADAERIELRGALYDAVAAVLALPAPDDLLPLVPHYSAHRLADIDVAVDRLSALAAAWKRMQQ